MKTSQHSQSDLATFREKFDMDEILNCMHCGFCLPTCPTYQETGLETYSPRGRIALMKAVAQDKLPVDEEFEKNMYACLGCRACETACPAGVSYGSLIETAREVVEDTKQVHGRTSWLRRGILRGLFMQPRRLQLLGNVLWFIQVTGLQSLANRIGLIRIFPREMAEMQVAVERVASPMKRRRRTRIASPDFNSAPQTRVDAPSHSDGSVTGRPLRVGLFTGCIMDILFFETNQATARLLSKLGCEVEFVGSQACCGALHAHSGDKADAIELAKRNILSFEQANVDVIVNNAGGCGAALKEYAHWLKDDPNWCVRAEHFVSKMRDASEILAELPALHFTKRIDAWLTYQDSCHLAHGQGIRNQPRYLLRGIPGVEYIELPYADHCCGSAGIYNITNFEMSMKILDRKMDHVKSTKATIIATSNPGCLLQMKVGIVRAGLEGKVRAVHIMDLLNEAL